jgi:hypothetical protein
MIGPDRDSLAQAHLAVTQLLKSRVITDATRRSAEILKSQLESELTKAMAQSDAVLSCFRPRKYPSATL